MNRRMLSLLILAAPVAAVEVINAGAVWMSTKLSAGERDQLAAAAAALLLYQDLES